MFFSLLCVLGLLKSQRAADLLHYQCWSVAQRAWGWARNKPQLSCLCRYWVNWICSFIPTVQRLHNVPGQLCSWGVLQFNQFPIHQQWIPWQSASRHHSGSDPWFWRHTDQCKVNLWYFLWEGRDITKAQPGFLMAGKEWSPWLGTRAVVHQAVWEFSASSTLCL